MSNPYAVDVYFNLHKHVWSVRKRGRVIGHSPNELLADCRFVVQPAGHAKVLREKRKNVHAFARGSRREYGDMQLWRRLSGGVAHAVTYNPFKGPFFYEKATGREVVGAEFVQLRRDRSVLAYGLRYGERNVNDEQKESK